MLAILYSRKNNLGGPSYSAGNVLPFHVGPDPDLELISDSPTAMYSSCLECFRIKACQLWQSTSEAYLVSVQIFANPSSSVWSSTRCSCVSGLAETSVQEGDLDNFVKEQNGKYLEEDEILLKFVQICLGLQHVHSKVSHLHHCADERGLMI